MTKEQAEDYIKNLLSGYRKESPIKDFELYKDVKKSYEEFSDNFHIFLGCMEAAKEITPNEYIEFREILDKIHSCIYKIR